MYTCIVHHCVCILEWSNQLQELKLSTIILILSLANIMILLWEKPAEKFQKRWQIIEDKSILNFIKIFLNSLIVENIKKEVYKNKGIFIKN